MPEKRVFGFNEIEYASHTDVGVKRSHNQDAHAAMPATDAEHWQDCGHVFLVADGMGAHAVGELASKIAVDNIPHIFSKYVKEGPIAALRRAFVETNTIIYTRGKQNSEFEGMGTTGIALVLRPEGAWVGHIGDSRAYRIRGGVIEQLSFDHSLLWELARRQDKRPEELTGIPANVIVRSLGPEAAVQVDVEGPHPLEQGDVFLLCSDGLSGQVNDRVIGAVLSALPPGEATRFLVHMANLHGGPDNTTVIVVRVGGNTEVAVPTSEAAAPTVPRLALLMYYLSRVPWAFAQLALGIVLAVIAIAMHATEVTGDIFAFIVSGMMLLGGIVTLMVQNFRESRDRSAEPEQRILQVYRQTACPLDIAAYERLLESAKALETDIKTRTWEYDVKAYHDHQKQAAQHLKQNRMRDAFREQCRAMLVLMESVHLYRGRSEGFKPSWDKPKSQPRHSDTQTGKPGETGN